MGYDWTTVFFRLGDVVLTYLEVYSITAFVTCNTPMKGVGRKVGMCEEA